LREISSANDLIVVDNVDSTLVGACILPCKPIVRGTSIVAGFMDSISYDWFDSPGKVWATRIKDRE
jgi:hypothetical protein